MTLHTHKNSQCKPVSLVLLRNKKKGNEIAHFRSFPELNTFWFSLLFLNMHCVPHLRNERYDLLATRLKSYQSPHFNFAILKIDLIPCQKLPALAKTICIEQPWTKHSKICFICSGNVHCLGTISLIRMMQMHEKC